LWWFYGFIWIPLYYLATNENQNNASGNSFFNNANNLNYRISSTLISILGVLGWVVFLYGIGKFIEFLSTKGGAFSDFLAPIFISLCMVIGSQFVKAV
jgi:hypothetical protein